MVCDRCKRAESMTKKIWTPDGFPLDICKKCRDAIDKGATFTLEQKPVRLSRMAKQMRREDESSGVSLVDLFITPAKETNKVIDSPFARTKWGKK